MRKKTDIKRQLISKYCSFIIIIGVLCLVLGVILAKQIVMDNSAELLSNFAKETGKSISNIIDLEIEKVEMIADTPILYNADQTEEEKMDYLREIVQQYGYKKAALIDLEGNCKTINGEEVNVSDLEYFKVNLRGGSYLTAPYNSKADGGLQIAISTPLFNNGKMVGILFFSKDAEDFSSITNEITFGNTGTAYVVDENGTNIINRDIDKIIGKVNRIEDAKVDAQYSELGAITEKMIAGENATGSYMLDGKRKFLGYAPIEAKGWAVGVTVELEDMLSGLVDITIYMGIFIIAVMLGMILLTYRIASDFSTRLLKVQEELDQMVKGDFTPNEKKYSIMDEISEIDHTLQMAKASLSEMVEKMQITNEMRKELTKKDKK